MSGIEPVLSDMGVGVASSAVWSTIQKAIANGKTDPEEVSKELANEIPEIDIEGAQVISQEAIRFIAENGPIRINNSHLDSESKIIMTSEKGGEFSLEDSTSENQTTAIVVEGDAAVRGSNGGEIVQDEDGIEFRV
ncbi:hypothetical protein [Haloferax marisrubri]|uniref:hypothetical protein n=1 Tax=Haloferax marisrubri TaxID=1544719 RepID=UPI0011AF8135|nr:hypothetical protein [Haloferax marisrubri]